MADEEFIQVSASPKLLPGEVALWEKDDAHPDGEIFIDNNLDADGNVVVHDVAETAGVNDAINKGRLVKGGVAKKAALASRAGDERGDDGPDRKDEPELDPGPNAPGPGPNPGPQPGPQAGPNPAPRPGTQAGPAPKAK